MANLIATAFFTRNTGDVATGLALADIDFYLTRQVLLTGVDSVVWDGTQNPTEEIDNVGAYSRILATADFSIYAYYLRATYTGVVALDQDDVTGSTECWQTISFPSGAIEMTYVVTNSVTGLPIDAVDVWISTDVAGLNVIWRGVTNAFGIALDASNNLPWLDAGTYAFFSQKIGFSFTNPDLEVVA